MPVSALTDLRAELWPHLACADDGTVYARFLGGAHDAPAAPARWSTGKNSAQILVTEAQFQAAEERHEADGGVRTNLHAQFESWFTGARRLRSQPDALGRGAWYSVTAAANFFRLLYSQEDYWAAGRGKDPGTAVNGWLQWAFGGGQGRDHLLKFSEEQHASLAAWLQAPEGPIPLPLAQAAAPAEDAGEGSAVPSTTEVPAATLRGLYEAVGTLEDASSEIVDTELAAFRERFPLERLERLSGRDLLIEMHGRESRDSLVYWLEFKNDDTFDTRRFGSIRGGSALKFGVFQKSDGGGWWKGVSGKPVEIGIDAAAEIAERQRDELLAAAAVVQALPTDLRSPAWEALQSDIAAAAPTCGHLAFFHKVLSLHFPELLDDYHSLPYQQHVLASLGIPPEGTGIYSAASTFVALLRLVRDTLGPRVPMSALTAALNRLYGAPVRHWRVGTGQNGEHWDAMRRREVVAIGWGELGDLDDVVGGFQGREGIDALKGALAALPREISPQQIGKQARQIWAFYNSMQEGDRVYAAYGKKIFGVGEVVGPYTYEQDEFDYAHRHRVQWISTEPFQAVSRAGLQTTVYNFSRALDIVAQAARHLDTSAAPVPRPKPAPIAAALAPIAAQLERKGQVILYGPPGTGKTYHALQAAEDLVARASRGTSWAGLTAAQRAALKGAGDPDHQRIWMVTFHPAYGYEDFVEGLRARPVAGGLEFQPEPGLFRRVCQKAAGNDSELFVIIIDEFNRGDAPRIFGELITLLELDKRGSVHVQLPLSAERLTVPSRVRLLATMNTADRSIALLDAALRRRFGFLEFLPDPEVLAGTNEMGIQLGELLKVVNERLLGQLGDEARNLQVGHAYFMSGPRPVATVTALRSAVRYDLFPLLQEYCAGDPRALHAIVGDAFYDVAARRFRDELFAKGRESDFLEALISWAPERLAAAEEPVVDPTADLDEDDDE